jgi:hypothetical protein
MTKHIPTTAAPNEEPAAMPISCIGGKQLHIESNERKSASTLTAA